MKLQHSRRKQNVQMNFLAKLSAGHMKLNIILNVYLVSLYYRAAALNAKGNHGIALAGIYWWSEMSDDV